VYFYGVIGKVHSNVGVMKEVVNEIFLDDMRLVAQAYDKLSVAIGRINLHDVPKDRLAPYLDHRLGAE
jgi:hypothetical protein